MFTTDIEQSKHKISKGSSFGINKNNQEITKLEQHS